MTIEVGDLVTATMLGRIRPRRYSARASGTVAASSTNVDVPGCSITFDVETSGARVGFTIIGDFDSTGAVTSGSNSVRALVDGTDASPVNAVWGTSLGETANQREASNIAYYERTDLSVGSHTVKLQGTTVAGMIIQVFTTINVEVEEVL